MNNSRNRRKICNDYSLQKEAVVGRSKNYELKKD